jgi:MT0933-like antitoxin protein
VGFLDKLKGKAKTAVDQHGDKIAGGIDKAASMADKKTKGKYTDRIQQGTGKTKEALDKLDGKSDGDLGGPGNRPAR